MSETAPSSGNTAVKKGGFGIPRSYSVPAEEKSAGTEGWNSYRHSAVDNDTAGKIISLSGNQNQEKESSHNALINVSQSCDKAGSDRIYSREVNLSSKCDVHIQGGIITPGVKLFASATKQILSSKQVGLNRSISDPGGDMDTMSCSAYHDLIKGAAAAECRNPYSDGNRSRSSSICSDQSTRCDSQEVFWIQNPDSVPRSEDTFVNKELPEVCPW